MSNYHAAFLVLISFILSTFGNHLVDPDFCMIHYPYTFSKCLQICASDMDSTCLDDQLCLCNSTGIYWENYQQLGTMERAQRFGADEQAYCEDSKFCLKNCQDVEERSFTQGIVCTSPQDPSIKSCVCGM